MEESDLLKERLQAITEKHHIQRDIRQRKLELDQEKLKLQHLKKKALKEKWLLQDSVSHNATDSPHQQSLQSDQQETRALQLNIQRIEMEVESLEREESVISANESFILDRLKAVEKSPEEIIKEAQDSFIPAVVTTEINVTKNLLKGESTILSTATVPPEELNQHTGLRVYDDSWEESCVSELSANEVGQLLRSATVHRQVNQNHQNHSRRQEHWFYNHQDEKVEGDDLRNNIVEKDLGCRENWQRKPLAEQCYSLQESHPKRQEETKSQSNLREGHRFRNHKGLGHHHGNQNDWHYSSYQVRSCYNIQEGVPASHPTNTISRSNSRVNGGKANGCLPPRSHDQEVVSASQQQLCYTPASYIPLCDYISVDEDELYHYSHNGNPASALYGGSMHSDRAPSPLYGDDALYTILNAMDTTEPVTAIFMGFQTTQDDSGQGVQFEGSLKAELVVIEDDDDISMKDKKTHGKLRDNSNPTGSLVNGNMGTGDAWKEKRVDRGTRKTQKKHKPCCTVC
ncbi:palmdelphin-like [Pempheris klunzingeri]|uniref:palmdelphin-like n=1 Tax=Pempheris klunzingeri TaxID=3127111 RepID=UPI00397FFDD6